MANLQKVGMYFFITGMLIAIFSGAFRVPEDMVNLKLVALIFTGVFVGMLNIDQDQELPFLLATGVFIIASRAIDDYLASFLVLSNLGTIVYNLIIFVSSAAIVVALKLILAHASMRQREEHHDEHANESWNIVIFVAVCFAFVDFILEVFFYTPGLVLTYVNYAVILIFVIDAIILYGKSKNTLEFIRYHWLDIIAIIPFAGVFQLAKTLRIIRIARFAGKTAKLGKLAKASHSAKFFSNRSGFNQYIKQEK